MTHSKWVRNSYLYAMVLFIALAFSSCFEDIQTPPGSDPPTGNNNAKTYYVSGTGMNESGVAVATLWKAGIPVNLSASYPDAVVYNSAGFGMAVSGKDVYVCGVIYTSKGNYPIYWKNGLPVLLTPGNGEATAIAVVGTNVYVSGVISNDNGNYYGVIWKNGVLTPLTAGEIYSSAGALVVSGGNVYVGGHLIQDGKTFAAYWKNGSPVLLTSGDNFATVQSLAIKGATVYTAGIELGNDVGKYWKNGEVVNLTDGSSKVIVSAVYTTGNDVYVAGKRFDGSTVEMIVWKNEIIISTTPMNANGLDINAVKVLHNKILVSGNVIYRNDNSSIYADATVWANGVPSTLAQGADGTNVYFANSIEVINGNH